MDIKGLRSLNLVGTILFCIIGIALVSVQYIQLSQYREAQREIEDTMGIIAGSDNSRDAEYNLCIGLLILWLITIVIFTIFLYNYTVLDLDRGNYKAAKQGTLEGIIVGFAGGIIPLIIFIISYVSFDDAVRTHKYGPAYYGPPQPQFQIGFCVGCKKQIPFDSKLCPYCGAKQPPIQPHQKLPPPPPKRGYKIMK
jgi:hypothetical protein